jgi:hypothetical protein
MLWLAPPVLFTLGAGISKPMLHEGFGRTPDAALFVDARVGVGYPAGEDTRIGLRLRGSHMDIQWGDLAPPPYDEYLELFDLYTLDVGAFGELDSGAFTAMLWLGAHVAYVDAYYNHYTDDNSIQESFRESFIAGPALAGGVAVGVHAYRSGRYRVTVYGEMGFTTRVFLTDRAFGGDHYTYKPLSLGVAVRF